MKKFAILGLLALIFFFGCRSVDAPESEPCKSIPYGPDAEWRYSTDTFKVWGASFNPKNQDEFVFVHQPYANGIRKLVKYNMVSKQKSILLEGPIIYSPSWGANGWILFNKEDGSIYKVRGDGSQLTQMTTTTSNWAPIWNPDATKFAYYSNPTEKGYTCVCDPDGNVLDTLFESGIGMSWNHPRYSPYPTWAGIHLTDMIEDKIINLSPPPAAARGKSGLGAIFVGSENLIYSYVSGIYSINLNEREPRLLKATCNSALYESPDYSPQHHKLIWLKKTYTQVTPLDMLEEFRFVLTDVDMQNEEEIDMNW